MGAFTAQADGDAKVRFSLVIEQGTAGRSAPDCLRGTLGASSFQEIKVEYTIRAMDPADLGRIAEIDRSESAAAVYVCRAAADGRALLLVREDRPFVSDPWDAEGVRRRVTEWGGLMKPDGAWFGAFETDRLVGFVVLGAQRWDGSAELVAIFVDAAYRGEGIGSLLMRAVEEHACRRGTVALSIYSVPTARTVDFYLSHGYRLVGMVDKSTVRCYAWDIVLDKSLL